MGAEGAAALAASLCRGAMPKLEVLKLGRNAIGDQGLVALAPPLRRLPALREVYLYSNKIGDVGVEALLTNLGGQEQLRQLQTLNLSGNLISGDAGCATLIAAMNGGALPPLEALGLDENTRTCAAAAAGRARGIDGGPRAAADRGADGVRLRRVSLCVT